MQKKVIHRLDVFGEKSHDSCPFLARHFLSETRRRRMGSGPPQSVEIGLRYSCAPSPPGG
jgi:hypothetical protein